MDLSVRLTDQLTLKNPIMTASGTFGYGDEVPALVDVNQLGGLVTKSVTREPREGHPPPRIAEMPAGMLNAIGLANMGIERFCEKKLPFLNGLETAVFVSVAGSTMDEYEDIVRRLEEQESQVAGYENNISWPNVDRGGMEFGVSCELTEELTWRIRGVTDRYLIIKLSPNVTVIEEIARAAESSGADAVSAINTVVAMGIDPKTGRFSISKGLGGLSGPAIRPIALASVYKVARSVSIPVIGMGGIMDAGDVVSFIRAGAQAVQIGTANYRDPNIGVRIAEELASYLTDLEVPDLGAIRGDAHS